MAFHLLPFCYISVIFCCLLNSFIIAYIDDLLKLDLSVSHNVRWVYTHECVFSFHLLWIGLSCFSNIFTWDFLFFFSWGCLSNKQNASYLPGKRFKVFHEDFLLLTGLEFSWNIFIPIKALAKQLAFFLVVVVRKFG